MISLDDIRNGNRLALSRLLSRIEDDQPEGQQLLNDLFPLTGNAHLIGVTGAPGTGKSSLTAELARHYRNPPEGTDPKKIAIVAVDPSSPFTGGAVLGDRIRMRELAGDPGVFIRSMASRGSLGGLAKTTAGVVQAFDAAGFDIILIETVGAGQAEVDIARLAHTTLVVEAPGLGDDIQAIKAGILEIADILVVNKADRPGVENTERALRNMLNLAHPVQRIFQHHGRTEVVATSEPEPDADIWFPRVCKTVATESKGIAELGEEIGAHLEYLKASGDWQRRERARLQNELNLHIQNTLLEEWRASARAEKYDDLLESLLNREISPQGAADRLIKDD
jgi:LAO/AO transport system kinase